MPSRSKKWSKVRSLEDVQAVLVSVMRRQKVILTQAWREGSWDQVFAEANEMSGELEQLHRLLSERWADLFGQAQDDQ